MSETTGTTGTAVVHEAYSFACMRCGHGWEQSYEIEHHVDGRGQAFVVYKADGQRVPSPLSSPTCLNCGGHVVRIMRAGRVSSVMALMAQNAQGGQGTARGAQGAESGQGTQGAESGQGGEETGGGDASSGDTTAGAPRQRHLSDLLHPFQHRR
ncbi:hypothetical protein [Streptomyces sp. NPDC005805]|uniref:hypothetical protein n=1 Tax=Streptomyces sp. NPDC005805 TaxID=3157068 RepID=UPI00340F5854